MGQIGTGHATGDDFDGTVGTMLIMQLGPGNHRFTPFYKTPSALGKRFERMLWTSADWSLSIDLNSSVPHQTAASRVIDLGPNATVLFEVRPDSFARPSRRASDYTQIPGK